MTDETYLPRAAFCDNHFTKQHRFTHVSSVHIFSEIYIAM